MGIKTLLGVIVRVMMMTMHMTMLMQMALHLEDKSRSQPDGSLTAATRVNLHHVVKW